MKKFLLPFLCFAPLCLGLFSCGSSSEEIPTKVSMLFGTKEYEESQISATSHMKKLEDETALEAMESGKENFTLIVLGRGESGSHETCSCWQTFHEKNIVAYQKNYSFLFYYIYSDQLTSDHGMKFGVSQATIGIFEDGVCRYQNSDSDESSSFYSSYSSFQSWMNARISKPRVFFVSKSQLDSLYQGNQEFSIYFSRQSCSDCLYMQRGIYKNWYSLNQTGVEDSYVIDCDAVGIASIKDSDGNIHSYEEDSTWGKEALKQYQAFKDEYGLSYSLSNHAGYLAGAFPTIFHINPDGSSKKGDVIDSSGVFFNETIEDSKIKTSYFDGSRDNEECLSYLSNINAVKNLVGLEAENTRDAIANYEQPLLEALLNYIVGSLN